MVVVSWVGYSDDVVCYRPNENVYYRIIKYISNY